MRDMHRWEQLRPEEFLTEQERAPVVYCAFGPMEDHGLQNALGVDPGKAHEICRRAAHISGGIVFPMVPFAPAGAPPLSREQMLTGEFPLFPPSLFVSVELCRNVAGELFERFEALGFRLCVGFGGHGPAASLLKQMAGEHNGDVTGMSLLTCGSTTYTADIIRESGGDDPKPLSHGGKWETAMNMALNSDYVDLSRVRDIDPSPIPSQLKGRTDTQLRGIEAATVAFGETLIDTAAERLAAEVKGRLG
ncbi:MAG: creatininase family protein [Lentisphaerae bacterium]|nr:creatininase family protein [Lentisphaerota bacterium]